MNAIKSFQRALILIVFSLLTGCSDQLMNPEISSSGTNGYESLLTGTGNSAVNRLNTEIDLKPYSSYTFSSKNTDFDRINTISAEIITAKLPTLLECQGLSIYSISSDADIFLSCKSSGLNLMDITVENTSDQPVRVSVVLTGKLLKSKPVKY